ncbi:S41 family peptidase [Polaribacter sp. R77954]|uniref:S41 family peptidase n=1 Tax=Polaribacter sp. R77954 TaxID=3093870 RepID=UPI0037C9A1DA
MKLRLLFLLLLISYASCVSVKKHNQQITKLHAVTDLRKDVDNLYLNLQKYHPKLYQYKSKEVVDFKFDSLKKAINTPLNSSDFYKKTVSVIAQLGHGHTNIFPPKRKRTKEERKIYYRERHEFNELSFEYLNKQLFLSGVQQKDSLLLGAEVLQVNGESVADIDKKYRKMFSSDGYNTTFYDKAIGKQFKVFYYRDNGAVDSVSLTLQVNDSLFTKTFRKFLKEEKSENELKKTDSIKPKPVKKEVVTKNLTRKEKRKYNKTHGFNALENTYNRNLKFIGKDSTIAYMKIRSFTNGDYKTFYNQTFTELARKKTQHLIIDLRYNGGGRAVEILDLYKYLTNKEFQFFAKSNVNTRVPLLTAAFSNQTPIISKIIIGIASPLIATYNVFKTEKENNQLYFKYRTKIQQPNPLNYKGKIYVLINGYSFSSSAVLSTHLHATKRAIFVGQETGGAYNGTVAGYMRKHQLPHSKVTILFGVMNLTTPYQQNPDGYGIKPDVEILPTLADRRNKIDPELEWILKDIEGKQ